MKTIVTILACIACALPVLSQTNLVKIIGPSPIFSAGGAGGGGQPEPDTNSAPKIAIKKELNDDLTIDCEPADLHIDLDGTGFKFLFRLYQPSRLTVFPSIRHQPSVQFKAERITNAPPAAVKDPPALIEGNVQGKVQMDNIHGTFSTLNK